MIIVNKDKDQVKFSYMVDCGREWHQGGQLYRETKVLLFFPQDREVMIGYIIFLVLSHGLTM
jgi:hypothetical protein